MGVREKWVDSTQVIDFPHMPQGELFLAKDAKSAKVPLQTSNVRDAAPSGVPPSVPTVRLEIQRKWLISRL